MQPKLNTPELLDGSHRPTRVHDANFYALPFASQMIVWAVRKRLDSLCEGKNGSDEVLPVFHMADWGKLYAALLTIVDTLITGKLAGKLQRHAVNCPCLAPHEAYLLNALAHLQNNCANEAILCMCEIMAPAATRLSMPHLRTIAEDTSAKDLEFAYVDLSMLASATQPTTLRGLHHVH